MDNDALDSLLQGAGKRVGHIGPKNGLIRHIKSLANNSKPNPRRLFIADGIWSASLALRSGIAVDTFIFCPERITTPEATQAVRDGLEKAAQAYIVSEKVLDSLSEKGQSDGIFALCEFPRCSLEDVRTDDALVVVLDGLEIPGNIGTIIRACDAADIEAIFVCNRRARLTHPKLLRSSMGSALCKKIVEFEEVGQCREWLDRHSFNIYLADSRAEVPYYGADYAGNSALVVGSERYGITRQWYEGNARLVSIPMFGACDSLNVAVATSIILYEMRLRKSQARL